MSRVCIVTPESVGPIRQGGMGMHCLNLARHLADGGADVTIVVSEMQDDVDRAQTRAHCREQHLATLLWLDELPEEPREPVQLYSPRHTTAHRLYRWLRSADFSAAHFQDWHGNGSVCLRAKQTGRAFRQTLLTVTTHGPSEWVREGLGEFPRHGRESLIDDALERASVELADILICPSRSMREWLESRGWALAPTVEWAPYLCPVAVSRTGDGGLPPGELREVVFFGHLGDRQGLLPFLDALEQLAADGAFPAVHVTFLGAHQLTARGASETLLAEFSARHARRFHVEILADRDHAGALAYLRGRRGALAVTPSLADGAPSTVLACLVSGVPLLASDRGGIPELVGDRAHLLVPRPDVIAERLREVASAGLAPLDPPYSHAVAADRWRAVLARDPSPSTRSPTGRVSVIVPHYNQPELLGETLAALAAQSAPPHEVVVVDDGSTGPDVSGALHVLEAQYRGRGWKFLRCDHRGPAAARNAGAARSTGEALIFVDADNRVGHDLVKSFADGLAASGADIVTCAFDAVVHDGAGAQSAYLYCPLGPWLALGVLENTIGDVCAIVRRDVFFAVGGFDVANQAASEDWQFFVQAAHAGYSFGVIPDPLFTYEIRADSHARRHSEAESASAALRALPEAERRWARPLVLAARGAFGRLAATTRDADAWRKRYDEAVERAGRLESSHTEHRARFARALAERDERIRGLERSVWRRLTAPVRALRRLMISGRR